MCKDNCVNSNGCICVNRSKTNLRFSPKYSEKEIELMVSELDNLRVQNKMLLDLCLPKKFKTAWEYGYQSGIFVKGDLSIDLKNELYAEDIESIIQDELSELEKDDGS